MAKMEQLIERLPLPLLPPNLEIKHEIGFGAWGIVYAGVFDGRQVAVKGVHKLLVDGADGQNPLDSFCEECDRLKELEHPYVIKFLGAFKDAKLGPLLVMEKMKENLRQFLINHKDKLAIHKQIRISLEITQGVAFLHQLTPPVVHRDLNDKNVMFTFDGVAKIGDFGQSKLKKDIYLRTTAPGMVSFMPPEALRTGNAQYDESLDVFSLGVLMLEIGTQQEPAHNLEGISTIPEIDRRADDLGKMNDLLPLKPLIRLCLKDDRKERPKAADLETWLNTLHKEPSLQEAEEVIRAKEEARQECREMKEHLDRTIAEKCQLEEVVEDQKKAAKDWKMQLDETTAKLLLKQDEFDGLKQQFNETTAKLLQKQEEFDELKQLFDEFQQPIIN